MRNWIAITVPAAFVLSLSACGGSSTREPAAGGPEAEKTGATCPGGGDRLPITGICAGAASAYLNPSAGDPPDAPDGCGWIVQETRFEDEALFYRATRCGDKTTRLAFTKGAGMASLAYDSVAFGDAENAMKGQVLARVAGSDSSDRTATLLRIARDAIDDPGQQQACSVRNIRIEGWPEDALVVDVSASEAAEAPPDEPRSACGPFGLNEDEAAFWRVFQGRSWFFQLGQDVWQVDPASFTLLAKGTDGRWIQVE